MRMLHDSLADFATAIVAGEALSPKTPVICTRYSVETALAVYRTNYFGNLHDALANAYPVIVQLVGEEFFRYLTKQFIAHHSSTSGNLHLYGAEMAGFLASFKPAQNLVYLPDVAALEWACHRAYFAEDVTPLDRKRLVSLSPEHYADMVLYLDPACRWIGSRYPIVTIWNAHQPGADSNFHIDLSSGPSNALVFRLFNTVMVHEMPEAEALWMQSILSGDSLGKATETALECQPDFDLGAAFKNLVDRRILTDFTLEIEP